MFSTSPFYMTPIGGNDQPAVHIPVCLAVLLYKANTVTYIKVNFQTKAGLIVYEYEHTSSSK